MASVYLARHQTLKQDRAIKVMSASLAAHDGFVQLFYREARLSARLRHPNVVQMYDVGEEDGVTYLVMELLEGRSLRDVIQQDGPLPVERAVHFVQQLAAALDYAHAEGVAHRDVKPANAFVSSDDHLTLVDFGIARAADGTRLSITHGIGTPEYMAPEIFDERLDRPDADDHRLGVDADLYALGVVAYELLTGRLPFSGRTPQAIVFGQVHRPPEPLRAWRPELSERLEAVVLRQLAKRPMERFGRPLDFAARLSGVARLDALIESARAALAEHDVARGERLLAAARAIDPSAPTVEALLGEIAGAAAQRQQQDRLNGASNGITRPEVQDALPPPRRERPSPPFGFRGRVRAGAFALVLLAVFAMASLYALAPAGVGSVAGTEVPATPVAWVATPAPTQSVAPAPTVAVREPSATVAPATPTTVPVTPTPAPAQLLLAARSALEAGEVLRALQLLTALKQSNDGLPGLDDALVDAHLKYSQNLLDEQQLDAAWGQFEAALALRPGSDAAEQGKQ